MEHYQPLAELIGFKGINADFIEEMLPNADNPLYLTDGDNVLIKGGKICKLQGVDYLNSISSPRGAAGFREVLGLPIFENYEMAKKLLAVTPHAAAYLSDDNTFTDLGLTLAGTRDSVLSFANIDNKCAFVLSDDGTVYEWDGGSAAQLLDPATLKARYLLAFKTYLILVRPISVYGGIETEHYNEIWPSYPGDVGYLSGRRSAYADGDRGDQRVPSAGGYGRHLFPEIHPEGLLGLRDGGFRDTFPSPTAMACSRPRR